MEQFFQLRTVDKSETAPLGTHQLVGESGSPFQVVNTPPITVGAIRSDTYSLGRYRAFLLPNEIEMVTLGEGWTPLVEATIDQRSVYFKMEGLNPTGSFKDRGAALLVSLLRAQGFTRVHDDSSGNAGAALAAYAARAGLDATLFVPAYASPAKLAQVQLYGATLKSIEGARSAATDAAIAYGENTDSYYASHAHHAIIIQANRSIAYELWEQFGTAPDVIILPVGQGTQLIGLFEGFSELKSAGLIDTLPRLIAVQAETCAPLYHQWKNSKTPIGEGDTLAEGIRIAHPIRDDQILHAIEQSKGEIVTVSEGEIIDGLRELLRMGIGCEPTCAVVLPALRAVREHLAADDTIVLSITGSGLKIPTPSTFTL